MASPDFLRNARYRNRFHKAAGPENFASSRRGFVVVNVLQATHLTWMVRRSKSISVKVACRPQFGQGPLGGTMGIKKMFIPLYFDTLTAGMHK